jgi:hypothetical protein
MTESNIFRRLHEPPKGGYVSKVEKMDSSTDSSTEIQSVDASDHVRKIEEIPSLISESDMPISTSMVANGKDSSTPKSVVTPEKGECANDDFGPNDKSQKLRPRRGRIVSLDRGQQKQRGNPFVGDQSDVDEYLSQDSASPHTDGQVSRHHRRTQSVSHRSNYPGNGGFRRSSHHDDESSSDDDSSYFASNLPSPKSGRSFSVSSTTSAPARTAAYQIEKGASLSFSSDEGDDETDGNNLNASSKSFHSFNPQQQYLHPSGTPSGVHFSPMSHPNRAVADMHLYPQRITRVHSVSSLVSSASSDNEAENHSCSAGHHRHTASVGSLTSSVSTAPDLTDGTPMHQNSTFQYSADLSEYAASRSGHYIDEYYNSNPSACSGMAFNHNMTSRWNYHQQLTPQQQHDWQQAIGIDDKGSGNIPFVYSEEDDVKPNATYMNSYGNQAATRPGSGGMAPSGSGSSGGNSPRSNRNSGHGERNEHSLSGSSGTGGATDSAARNIALTAGGEGGSDGDAPSERQVFKVYWQRWIMLMYMSALNLLSDWTCYSVAPISLLTEEAFGKIDPERLVVVFLGANAIASACEPIILARLGLRRTVLFGALLLMVGSIVKSGGLPPITPTHLDKGHAEVSLYMGFFLVGLSQPLYQCTPALLSASWFPEKERTMATGVALNANQLGIGFAFIFGTLLVAEADDIPDYFGLLSQIATIVFIGTLIQFDDAPPTPPSSSAKAIRGDLRMPSFGQMRSAVQNVTHSLSGMDPKEIPRPAAAPSPASNSTIEKGNRSFKRFRKSTGRRSNSTRRRVPRSQSNALTESGLAGSSAHYGSTRDAMEHIANVKSEVAMASAAAPSPAMGGRPPSNQGGLGSPDEESPEGAPPNMGQGEPGYYHAGMMPPGAYVYGYPPYQYPPYWMQQQQAFYQQPIQQSPNAGQEQQPPPPPGGPTMQYSYYPPPPMMMPYQYQQFPSNLQGFDPYYNSYGMDPYDEGTEPVVTITPHHLDIDIKDDQVIRSLHACMMRQGFSHALASFTVSGIVINTLSVSLIIE